MARLLFLSAQVNFLEINQVAAPILETIAIMYDIFSSTIFYLI
jgi:hypothetical protein